MPQDVENRFNRIGREEEEDNQGEERSRSGIP
jgi:hypothetical protein